ncbi:MAG: DUF3293 domain-containing protein [Cyanobacteria bacterium P01_D01_bin.36]
MRRKSPTKANTISKYQPEHLSNEQIASLRAAYQETLYEVKIEFESVTIRVGNRDRTLNRLVQHHHKTTWAFITAHNPYSQQLSAAENTKNNLSLQQALHSLCLPTFEAVGRDPQGEWPPEDSFLVMGIERGDAIALGKQFHQNAILFGTLETVPQLIWLISH